LGTYAENVTQEYVGIGHDVSFFTLNGGSLKTREILRGVEVHRPLIADASNLLPILKKNQAIQNGHYFSISSQKTIDSVFFIRN
jgi:hypothetical protein